MSNNPGNLDEFIQNLRNYFIMCIVIGVALSLAGTFLPNDLMFIMGMLGLVMAIGIGVMDFIYRVKDKRLKEKLK
ncbi:hypothetical protein HOV56_gp28 [Nitrosopumilus spindle-shaped virus]|uniref:Transmembrane protein n=2 Tax=Nitmarvirus NSV1 TaxID=2734593 RepID=A0A514K2Q2_9VIRU|nr:hypothetical protein HOV56_gp28 [Nitrosopumilus spindle-shaped virus]YP_010772857.1 hypothetical protein QIT54_gp27 [Nitrosopumilus spindle-shaped virus]YP_010772906.1 hypothetical protein QIT55_gp28 [Nitrosopumilus spindle-shaped virus]QDI73917.1 hypothetical protein [Nitrosopumilus spindle-shaped virus]QDI73965.1 hypothetical protein [Nitrosopumilus spindle-shaped virus]QDI74014.1 hypothetical protein [Nitrosopumilus spindle-shaped virus]